MKIVKYVIKCDGVPLLFNSRIVHSEAIDKCLSSGFAIIYYDITIDKFKVKCYGCIESLNVGSRKEDCNIIQNYLNKLLCTNIFESLMG